ncbi:Zinc finger, C6HC-type [Artemisia annua]|uniref:RBR-type E3 ubiquitin transferase n=1 Tax=Artemisia annua TaxID=35608 RepID=A0A2U1P441_ARTAN|nr:Zinc finger, C6HC-type [Artemisia annua]
MAGSSVFDPYSIDDDDSYFPPFIDQEPNVLTSDEKYAEQLQLQEALVFSSASRASTLSSMKPPIMTYESNQVPDRFCDICMDTKTKSEMFRNAKVCRHMFCFDCIRGHVAAKIQENITKVRCPDPNCTGVIGPEVCRSIVPKEVLHRWEKALCESLIIGAAKFYCPFKDCSALLVDDVGETVTSSECPHCNRLFCAQCKDWGVTLNLLRFHNGPGLFLLLFLLQIKDRSTSFMAGGSISDPYIIHDDDPYFPPLINPYINVDDYSIPDENYAEQLQIQEALAFSSASRESTSSSIKTPIVILDSQASRASTSSSPKTPIIILDSQDSHAFESSQVPDRFCDICMDTKKESEMFRNTKVCGHMFCFDCIRGHVAAKIQENITKVRCPDPNCKGVIGPEACRLIVPKEVLERWENSLCESLILGSEKFYCPFKDCSAMLVDDGGGAVTSSECPHCHRLFCAQCKVTWHSGMSCSEYQSLKKGERDPSDIMLRDLAKNKKWKRCPKCNFYVELVSGCLHIRCRCGHQFCYGCGKYHPDHRWHKCPHA